MAARAERAGHRLVTVIPREAAPARRRPRRRLLDEVSELVSARGLVAADGLLDTPYGTHITWCRRLEV